MGSDANTYYIDQHTMKEANTQRKRAQLSEEYYRSITPESINAAINKYVDEEHVRDFVIEMVNMALRKDCEEAVDRAIENGQ